MHDVVHIVDRDTPLDMQRQLDLLAAPDEIIVSLGAPPAYLAGRRRILTLAQPLKFGSAILLNPQSNPPPARVVHFWSQQYVTPRLAPDSARIILSLPAVEKRTFAYHRRILMTFPTTASVRDMILRGMPATHVSVLPPACALLSNAAQRRQALREALGVKPDEFLLAAPGAMIRPAGQKYACWVYAILREAHSHLRLLVPGTGRYESHVRYFAAGTGQIDEMLFTGDRYALEDCLVAADAAFFLCEQDCGVSHLVQAMAAGLPIVAAGTPDVAYCLQDGQAGLLVPPRATRLAAAAMLRVIDDPSLAATLGESARRRAGDIFLIEHAQRARQEIYSARLTVP